MARYRRYTRTIIKAPKQSWNRSFEIFGPTNSYNLSGKTGICIYGSAVYNAKDNEGYSTATALQATRIRVMGEVSITSNALASGAATPCFVKVYITFVPQAYYEQAPSGSPTAEQVYNYWRNLIESNPEYIMGQSTLNTKYQGGFPGEKVNHTWTVTSGKLKRNLKSGDRIIAIAFFKSLSDQFDAGVSVYFEAEASVRRN